MTQMPSHGVRRELQAGAQIRSRDLISVRQSSSLSSFHHDHTGHLDSQLLFDRIFAHLPTAPRIPLMTTEQATCANTSCISSANKSQEADRANSRRTTVHPYYDLVNPSQRGVSAHLPMSRGHFAIHVQAR